MTSDKTAIVATKISSDEMMKPVSSFSRAIAKVFIVSVPFLSECVWDSLVSRVPLQNCRSIVRDPQGQQF